MSPSTMLVVLVSGLLALAAWSRLAELYRRSALSRAALALGLRFEERAGRFIVDGPGALPALRNRGAVGRYLMTDGKVALFEHLSRAGTAGGAPAGGWRPLGAARVTGVPAFRVEARRPGVFGLAGAAYTAADEVTLDADHFGDAYQLYADDAVAARGLFSKAVVDFFARHAGYCLEVRGGWLVVDEGVGALDPAALGAQVDALRGLVALLERAAAEARGPALV